MRVLILGIDGYLGWSLAQYLTMRTHIVGGVDCYSRRGLVAEIGGYSAIPIAGMNTRIEAFEESYGKSIYFREGDIVDYVFIENIIDVFKPEAIVHFAENPSAPYSMKGHREAAFVQHNNIIGTLNVLWAMRRKCPDCHLIKLGTMGEYGTPNVVIPEGFFEIEYEGRKDYLPFPRQPGSFYHLSKVHDSHNVWFACKVWGLRSTDIMQGVVYGTQTAKMGNDPRLRTRIDFDECFGTVINRYCCQAVIGYPLSPYGIGHQKRGFLTLEDSMQCITLAIENVPSGGSYRVLNQLEEVYDITDLARKVQKAIRELGGNVELNNVDNPRVESEDHFYKPKHEKLPALGFRPTTTMGDELRIMLIDLMQQKERINLKKHLFAPVTKWR